MSRFTSHFRAGAPKDGQEFPRPAWRGMLMLAVLFAAASMIVLAQDNLSVVRTEKRMVLEPFDYQGVTLEMGDLRRQVDEVRAYYLRIPNDDLLKPFRRQAGLPAPGVELGGWYKQFIGHTFGQILSGLSRLYAATGDAACKDKAAALIHEYMLCLTPEGQGNFNEQGHYNYDKMVGGLVDNYRYCQNPEALACLSRITDWAAAHLDHGRIYGDNRNEWYTLSENLYRAYQATGDEKYRKFAEVWEYTDYWNMFVNDVDILTRKPDGGIFADWLHSYSHVNTLCGAAMAYIIKGDPRYLTAVRKAYDYFQANQVFASGGYGPWWEHFLPRDLLVEAIRGDRHDSSETQCQSWAIFKMTKYLLTLTGDARYAGWAERALYNMVGATIPMSGDGQVLYYSDYNAHGGCKRNRQDLWTCCTGSRPMAVADYADLIYFKDDASLYVNLYTPSAVTWQRAGDCITVRQVTDFPERPEVEIAVSVPHPTRFALKLRVPDWLTGPMKVTLAGQPLDLTMNDRHWAVVDRLWHDGDSLAVTLPMGFWLSRLDPAQGFPAAIMYGPVMMAVRAPEINPFKQINWQDPGASFVPCAGEPLNFRLAADPNVRLRPFYQFKEGEPYFVYFDPRMADFVPLWAITFNGPWQDAVVSRFAVTAGATAEYSFDGAGIRFHGYQFTAGKSPGSAEVSIDGQPAGVIDETGPSDDRPFTWERNGLPPGRHTIRFTTRANQAFCIAGLTPLQ